MNPSCEKALFALALEKPADKRPAFLDAVCEGDPALRQRLEALLAAYDARDSFLEPQAPKPASQPVKTIKAGVTDNPADDAVGRMVGHYKLLEKLGEGASLRDYPLNCYGWLCCRITPIWSAAAKTGQFVCFYLTE
jgi:hypothetical protein